MLLALREQGPRYLPTAQEYLMLLKLSKHQYGTFPNLKRQQHLIVNASFNVP